MKTRKVVLTYFKENGGYYTEGEYQTLKEFPFEVYKEVEDMLFRRVCPGLMEGHSHFLVHVDCVEHENNVPAVISDWPFDVAAARALCTIYFSIAEKLSSTQFVRAERDRLIAEMT